jgi:hypothetical protein
VPALGGFVLADLEVGAEQKTQVRTVHGSTSR